MDGEVTGTLGFSDEDAPEIDLDFIMELDKGDFDTVHDAQVDMIKNVVSSAPTKENIQRFTDELMVKLKGEKPMRT